MPSKTFGQYVTNFPKFSNSLKKAILTEWTKGTFIVQAEAVDRAPVLTGQLIGSASVRRAKLTPKGFVSAVVFDQPYATRLDDPKAGIRLRDVGEKVWVSRGQRATKSKKGELGYLQKAVDNSEQMFIDILKKTIGEEWLKF